MSGVIAIANTMPNLPVELLDQLKDIHLPNDVSWWPLALGWWLLLVLCLLLCVAGAYIYLRSQRKSTQEIIIAQSIQVFKALQVQSLTPKGLIVELSALLRRTAISLYGREAIAKLSGDNWLQFLNQQGSTDAFTKGMGRVLVDQPYRAEVDYDRQALLALIQNWLNQQLLNTADNKRQKKGGKYA